MCMYDVTRANYSILNVLLYSFKLWVIFLKIHLPYRLPIQQYTQLFLFSYSPAQTLIWSCHYDKLFSRSNVLLVRYSTAQKSSLSSIILFCCYPDNCYHGQMLSWYDHEIMFSCSAVLLVSCSSGQLFCCSIILLVSSSAVSSSPGQLFSWYAVLLISCSPDKLFSW